MDPLVYETKTVNGVDLEVAVANPGGERGLALLVHGFPELAFSWRFQIPMLAEMGYEVWAPNTRLCAVRANRRRCPTTRSTSCSPTSPG
ncbi:MAG: hypothetical protein R2697_18645 [Ilumatobacteraceae bacterium]